MNVQGMTPAVFRPLVTGTGGAAAPAAPAPKSAPAETTAAPEARETTLWDVLTDDEREFFTQQARLGTVTYRPKRPAAPAAGAPIGQRIDVRG